jgi:hypothetical protein
VGEGHAPPRRASRVLRANRVLTIAYRATGSILNAHEELEMTNRRSFLAACGSGCAGLRASWGQSISGSLFSTVETASGKVQGITNTGIREFKGIPYRAPTGGKNRYVPPKKPVAWTWVRECFGHTPVCPQTLPS